MGYLPRRELMHLDQGARRDEAEGGDDLLGVFKVRPSHFGYNYKELKFMTIETPNTSIGLCVEGSSSRGSLETPYPPTVDCNMYVTFC